MRGGPGFQISAASEGMAGAAGNVCRGGQVRHTALDRHWRQIRPKHGYTIEFWSVTRHVRIYRSYRTSGALNH